MSRPSSYHLVVPRKSSKSELLLRLEQSVKLIQAGKLPRARKDSLGNRLRKMDGLNMPDALEVGPEALDRLPDDDDW